MMGSRVLTRLGTGAVFALAATAVWRVAFMTKIQRVSEAEVLAALPASLKVEDAPDPEGEARYARLGTLASHLDKAPLGGTSGSPSIVGRSTPANEAILSDIERLLSEGRMRLPERKKEMPVIEFASLKNAAKLIALATEAAGERGDRSACGRWAALGIRFGAALNEAGGVVVEQLIAISIDAIAIRAAYAAEIEGHLDRAGRERLLALLTPRDGRSPEMAAAIRRDFQWGWMPILLNPAAHTKELSEAGWEWEDEWDSADEPILAGSFDSVATAKLAGGIYDALIDDSGRPVTQARHAERPLIATAERGLPDPNGFPHSSRNLGDTWSRLKYRVAMNVGSNTLGRQQAVSVALTGFGAATARQAANRNLLRAAILLRMGRGAAVIDPFAKTNLRFDPKRKIVWSVGQNQKDDGGTIGKGGDPAALDFGYAYGDHAWRPPSIAQPNFPPSAGQGPPPGFPRD